MRQAETADDLGSPAGGAPDTTGATRDGALEDPQALLRELQSARDAADASRDQHMRAVAEMDNIRRRAQRDVENAHRFGLEKLAQELLPVADSLEMASQSAATADAESLVAGQRATLQLLQKALGKLSIERIEPLGEPFDPDFHEAVAMQESATAAPDSVLLVVQPGYRLNGRLLRPARVIVARAPA